MSISTPKVKPVPGAPMRVATAAAAFGLLIVIWCAFWIGVGLLLVELVSP
jgi:hypothetical protein